MVSPSPRVGRLAFLWSAPLDGYPPPHGWGGGGGGWGSRQAGMVGVGGREGGRDNANP